MSAVSSVIGGITSWIPVSVSSSSSSSAVSSNVSSAERSNSLSPQGQIDTQIVHSFLINNEPQKVLELVSKIQPNLNAQQLMYKGIAQYMLQNYQDALNTLNESLVLNPFNPWAFSVKIRCLSVTNDPGFCLTELRKFKDTLRSSAGDCDPNLLYVEFKLLLRLKRVNEAKGVLDQLGIAGVAHNRALREWNKHRETALAVIAGGADSISSTPLDDNWLRFLALDDQNSVSTSSLSNNSLSSEEERSHSTKRIREEGAVDLEDDETIVKKNNIHQTALAGNSSSPLDEANLIALFESWLSANRPQDVLSRLEVIEQTRSCSEKLLVVKFVALETLGRYEEALKIADVFLQSNRFFLVIFAGKIRAHLALSQADKAIAAIAMCKDKILSPLKMEDPNIQLLEVKALIAQGKIQDAIQIQSNLNTAFPNSFYANSARDQVLQFCIKPGIV